MRVGIVGAFLVGLVAVGCSDVKHPASLVLTPGGSVAVTGPTSFQAVAMNTGAPISWAVTGGGTLSGTTGEFVVYRPPPDSTTPNLTATLIVTSGGATASATLHVSPPVTALPGLGADVDVRYDRWEIPHVTCAQAADCFRAQGYLHARDRLFQMDFLRRVATGRLAEMVGALGLSQDVQLRTLFLSRSGVAIGKALADNMDAGTRPKVQAYVDGINAYLAQLRASGAPLPAEYAQLPYHLTAADVPDWTLADVASFVRLQQYSLSSTLDEEIANGRFVTAYPPTTQANQAKLSVWIRAQQPSSEQTYTLQPSKPPAPLALRLAPPGARRASAPVLARWSAPLDRVAAALAGVRDLLKPLDGSTGSNNWVVSAAKSASGNAMVANDPHLSLQYPPNFHLAALTSTNPADHLDVTGGAFPGTPGAQVGRGQHVGWGVTVVGYDVTDVYQEQFLPAASCPGGGTSCVLFKGAPVNALQVPLAFQVRTAAGLVDAQTLPAAQRPPPGALVVPHHGPVIQAPDPTTGQAFSVRWTGHEDATQDLTGFLGLNTALDVDSAMAALNNYATGAQNFVLADDAGHIAFYPHALVPKRPWAGTGPPTQPLLPWFPLPGDGSAEWGAGVTGNCAASGAARPPADCWIADADLPQGKDPAEGFFITANADPLGVSANPVGGVLPVDAKGNYLSFSWDDSTAFRHARITELLQGLTANGGKVTQADMERIQADHASRMGAAFHRHIAAMSAGTADFESARTLLASWKAGGYDCPTGLDGTDPASSPITASAATRSNSAACHLFHVFARSLLPAVFSDDLASAGLGVSAVNAVKGMLYMLENPAVAQAAGFCGTSATACDDQVRAALSSAWASLRATLGDPAAGQWAWGRVHTFQPVSQFPLVTAGYQPGPFARPGGAFTVDVASPSLSGSGGAFPFGSSGNVRHVSMMAPSPVVRMQLPGPEVSEPYGVMAGPDLLGMWTTNTYFDYATSAQVAGATVASQRFTP
jgi:penicillin amidase